MTASITLFANLVNATFPELDGNFASYTPLTVIPCTVSGTNALTLAPFSGSSAATPAIAAYQNYMQFSGVFASNGSGALTACIGSQPFLNVYKDSPTGPVATTGAEAIQNNAFTLVYDLSLNSGAGGWHLYSSTASFNGGTIAQPLVLSSTTLSVVGGSLGASLTSTALTGNSLSITAQTITASQNLTAATLSVSSLASVTKLEVGASASSLTRMINGTGTLTFSITVANGVQNQTMALAGAQIGDSVILGLPASPPAGAGFTGFMAAAGTVNVRLENPGTVTLGAATITVNATALGFT